MATNNPLTARLGQFSEHQLLVLILTELKLQTLLLAENMDSDRDLDEARIEIMNTRDIVSGDAETDA